MKLGRRILTGSFIKTADTMIHGAVVFVMIPVIIRAIGNRNYGFWTMVSTFIGYYGFFDLGLSIAVNRHISRAFGRGEKQESNAIINTALILFSIIGAVTMIVTIGIAASCPLFMNNHKEIGLFRLVLLIAGLSLSLSFPLRVFRGVLTAGLRYDIVHSISIARMVASNILIYYFLTHGRGILTLTLLTALARLVEGLLNLAIALRLFPAIRIDLKLYRFQSTRSLFAYSWKAFLAQLADTLRFKIDSFVIAGFLNLGRVAVYSVAQRILQFAGDILQSAVNIMIPVFSQYEGRNDYQNIRAKFMTMSKISLAIAIFVGGSTAFYGQAFIARWLGDGFRESYSILLILFVPILIETSQNPSIQLLYGLSEHHYYMILNIGEALANLLLSIILVHKFGMYGVAMGTAIEIVAAKLLILPFLTCRVAGIALRDYYRTIFLTAVKTALPLLAYFFLVRNLIRPQYLNLSILGIVQATLIGPISFFLVLDHRERRSVFRAVGIIK